MNRILTRAGLLALLVIGGAPVLAAPTPVPGGANQVNAISGKLGETAFNGVLRIRITDFKETTDASTIKYLTPSPSQRVMVINVLLRNGTRDEFTDLLTYTLADKDDISVVIPTNTFTHANLHILQGAAERQSANFLLDRDFVPTKLIVQCSTCGARSGFRSVRFAITSP